MKIYDWSLRVHDYGDYSSKSQNKISWYYHRHWAALYITIILHWCLLEHLLYEYTGVV